jgi:hypothetical protein
MALATAVTFPAAAVRTSASWSAISFSKLIHRGSAAIHSNSPSLHPPSQEQATKIYDAPRTCHLRPKRPTQTLKLVSRRPPNLRADGGASMSAASRPPARRYESGALTLQARSAAVATATSLICGLLAHRHR